LLSQYGVAYRRGAGDFTLNHDYYGNREIGVILLKPLFNDLVLRQMQRLLDETRAELGDLGELPVAQSGKVISKSRFLPVIGDQLRLSLEYLFNDPTAPVL
jgi:hypothetical protein